MPDAQQGPRSWFERLSASSEAEPEEPGRPKSDTGAMNDPRGGTAPQPAHPPGQYTQAAPTRVDGTMHDPDQGSVTWRGEAPPPGFEQANSGRAPHTPEAPMSNPIASSGATETAAPSPTIFETSMPGSGVRPAAAGPAEEGQAGSARKWQVEELQHRWLITQAQLLDDPREAVHEAGLLIGEAMQLVTSAFTEQRDQIEREWKSNAHLDTDELRAVMQRYRKLFQYVLRACQTPDF